VCSAPAARTASPVAVMVMIMMPRSEKAAGPPTELGVVGPVFAVVAVDSRLDVDSPFHMDGRRRGNVMVVMLNGALTLYHAR